MSSHHPPRKVIVSRERVVAPPDRFIAIDDKTLVHALGEVVGSSGAGGMSSLQELMSGIVSHELSKLRRRIDHGLQRFGSTGRNVGGADLKSKTEAQLNSLEQGTLEDVVGLLQSCQYRLLDRSEWEAAKSEDFLLTLPVIINWAAMDTQLLRCYWQAHPQARAEVPDDLADHVLIFHRGVQVARMQGLYYDLKIDALLSFYILQPLWAFLVLVAGWLGLSKHLGEAPPGMEQMPADITPTSAASADAAEASLKQGQLHPNTISVERKTFARVFKDPKTIWQGLFKKVRLQEACFKDVVVLYRKAHPGPAPSELDIINDEETDLERNIVIRHFSQIPLADLEMVIPDKTVFVPPMVFVQLMVTAITGLVTALSMLAGSDKLTGAVAYSALALLASRAYQMYSAALFRKTAIERQIQKILFERSTAAQEKVVAALVDEMNKQHTRELLICYCVLLESSKLMTADELDSQCEQYLSREFGLKVDFTCESALPTLLEWGIITEGSTDGALQAVPLSQALHSLDAVWDGLFEFKGGKVENQAAGLVGLSARLIGQQTGGASAGPGTDAEQATEKQGAEGSGETRHPVAVKQHPKAILPTTPHPAVELSTTASSSSPAQGSARKGGLLHRIGRKLTG
ncbi:CGL64A [Auxenochlorella protothecoides x Auxenochlorella symbiontica]